MHNQTNNPCPECPITCPGKISPGILHDFKNIITRCSLSLPRKVRCNSWTDYHVTQKDLFSVIYYCMQNTRPHKMYIFVIFQHLWAGCFHVDILCILHLNNQYWFWHVVGCWSSAFIRRIIYKLLNACPFDYTALRLVGRLGSRQPV